MPRHALAADRLLYSQVAGRASCHRRPQPEGVEMCLLFAILAVLGPRALVFFWWLLEPARWAATFESAVVPLIGFLFLPWTTIMYVLVFPGGIEGLDWLWLGLGLFADIASYGGSAWGNRDQSNTTWTNYDGV